MIQILQSLKGLYGQSDSDKYSDFDKIEAFRNLENLHKKILNLDYEKELAELRIISDI